MRIQGARFIYFAVLVLQWYVPVAAQNSCIPTGINNTVINFPCGVNCDTLLFRIPHLKSTADYRVTTTAYNPFPFTNPAAVEVTSIYVDDRFSEVINIPFPFCFYDSVYNNIVLGSNSLLTFDVSTANQNNAYTLTVGGLPQTIPYAGGTLSGIANTYYPPASIMAAYQDIDPSVNPQGLRKIEYFVSGTAPCRKFVINYANIPLFGAACNSLINTHQIVLNESTGIIDVYFQNKFFCSSWPGGAGAGLAILGIQDWTRTRAVAAPGKNATQWTSQNEGYRFTPNGGASRFVSAQILRMNGTLIKNADTSTTVAGLLDISFADICPSANSEQFIIRTTFAACGTGPNLVTDDTITVNRTNSLNATETHTNVSCGNSDGTITINVPAGIGTPPYQYSLNGGPFQSSNIFIGLAAGSYNVMVQDPNGCNSALTVPIAITGSLNVGTPVVTNPSCSGVANGTITVNPLNGAPPYQYNLNNGPGGPWQTSNVFTGLAPGTYFLFVRDATGCAANNIIITVAPGQPLLATATTTSASCSGANNGTITVNVSNGTAPYQFSLNGGPPQNSNVFTGLAPGTYFINVRDVNNCVYNNLQAIVAPGVPLTATVSKTDVLCNGGSTGTITVNVTASLGTPPFQYSLDGVNFQTSNLFTGLAAGTYTVYFRDNNGCAGTTPNITITQPPALSSAVSASPVICFGQNNGVIRVSASGGNPPYTFSLDGINYQTADSFNVAAGNYTIYSRDNNGCIATHAIAVTQPPLLTASVTTLDASCDGGADGRITITANGGNGGYQYSIDGTNFQTSGIFNVNPGNYTVIARDSKNCNTTQNTVVGLNNNLTMTPAADEIICEGNSVQLQLNTNATQFAWTPPVGLSNASIKNPVASPVTTTIYVVTATLSRCSVNDTIIVQVLPAPVPDAGPDGFICFGQTYQLQGSGGTQFQWTPADYLDNPASASPLSTPAQTTIYSLHVVDSNGCNSLIADQIKVDVTPPIVVTTHPSDTIVYAGDQFQLSATSAGTDYVWTPSQGLSNPNVPNPVLTVSSDVTLTVTASTLAGCKGSADVIIKVYKGPDLYVPSGFTPNNDGKNDRFRPFPVGIKELTYFRVYNRWGQLLFSTNQLHDGWDGKFGGMDQPVDVYVWMAEGITAAGKKITKKGVVALIR